jgi:rod shape determining protein RodA
MTLTSGSIGGRTVITTGGNGTGRGRRGPSPWRHADPVLVVSLLAICAFGALMIYTATRVPLETAGLSPTYYVKKQLVFMAIGFVVMLVVAAIDYRRWQALAPVLYGLSIFMLLAVIAVGHKSKGAQAWFQVGSLQLEPSEFAKIGVIVALAAYVAAHKGDLTARRLGIVIGLFVIPFGLIYKQPDLGTALVLVAVLIAVLVVGGAKGRHLALLTLVAVIGIVGVVHFGVLKKYQQERLTSFVDTPNQLSSGLLASDAGGNEYNVAESKITISNGGIFGKGIGQGTQTNLSYVPEQRTDFIFTAVGEQTGLIGCAVLLLLFLLALWRTWRAASLARDLTGTLICVGVLAMVVFQVFENVGMTMGIMPIAGIPLPFVSYGGSAVIATFIGFGLVLSVRMRRDG